jgi:hypothetical protein
MQYENQIILTFCFKTSVLILFVQHSLQCQNLFIYTHTYSFDKISKILFLNSSNNSKCIYIQTLLIKYTHRLDCISSDTIVIIHYYIIHKIFSKASNIKRIHNFSNIQKNTPSKPQQTSYPIG